MIQRQHIQVAGFELVVSRGHRHRSVLLTGPDVDGARRVLGGALRTTEGEVTFWGLASLGRRVPCEQGWRVAVRRLLEMQVPEAADALDRAMWAAA